MSIEVESLTKSFGKFVALKNVSLEVPTGKLVALLGPSGSGKTTLLRIIAGLEVQDDGRVLFDGQDAVHSYPRERRVGFVFQHYALFRHMTVFENIAFGLRVKPRRERPSRANIREKVQSLMNLIQMEALAGRYPSQLSGGQRQRVALARALAVEPKVLLLDEPFGALDAKVRLELRRWLRRLHDEIHVTSVFVTHDQEEALEVADIVVVMNEGKIEQTGPPEEVYDHPATPFVYHFMGNVNLFHGRVENGKALFGEANIEVPLPEASDDGKAIICVRPHQLELTGTPNGGSYFPAEVKHINSAGPLIKVELTTGWGAPLQVEMPRERRQELQLKKGQRVFVSFREMQVFPEGPMFTRRSGAEV